MNMTKQKFLEILFTALLSTGIAFLQGLLANMGHAPQPAIDPTQAGVIGTAISTARRLG
jgi:hypothetical protein